LATSEAENMLMIVTTGGGAQEDIAAGSNAALEADTGISDSPHSKTVIEVESNSTQSSSSQSTHSTSSTNLDDIPISLAFPLTKKSLSSSTKTHIKPKTNISHEPVRTDIYERIIGLSQRKADIYNRFPVSHNPLRPPMIQPLNMVLSDENVEPSSSSQPSSTNQTQDTTVLYNLVSYQRLDKTQGKPLR
jgi:hypothetical protein